MNKMISEHSTRLQWIAIERRAIARFRNSRFRLLVSEWPEPSIRITMTGGRFVLYSVDSSQLDSSPRHTTMSEIRRLLRIAGFEGHPARRGPHAAHMSVETCAGTVVPVESPCEVISLACEGGGRESIVEPEVLARRNALREDRILRREQERYFERLSRNSG